MKKVAIIDYGAGNVQSVKFAMDRLGVSSVVTNDSTILRSASHVIFPGVGHALAAMDQLKKSGIDQLIPELEQPLLGICLGMQLLCMHSDEGDTRGLGIFQSDVKRFQGAVKIPAVGWSQLEIDTHSLFNGLSGAYFYFVHSYYATLSDQTIAESTYGTRFSAALAHNQFMGVQFHPERSGEAGAVLLTNFLNQ